MDFDLADEHVLLRQTVREFAETRIAPVIQGHLERDEFPTEIVRGLAELGVIDLWFLDESGFAPTLPTTSTWARTTVRPLVRDEPPQGRRLNVLGALAPCGDAPGLVWTAPAGKLDGTAFLEFVWRQVAGLPDAPERLPPGYRRPRPCAIVLDNYSVHRSKEVHEILVAIRISLLAFSIL